LIENPSAPAAWVFNQQSSINKSKIPFPACEEVRDRRHGESSLPPAAINRNKKGEQSCLV
jgi:hypothetical protein